MTGKLSLDDVSFAYPSRPSATILRRLNFSFSAGRTVALVGASGCGKSTVLQLLLRFYDPDSGAVVSPGVTNCFHWPPGVYRSNLSVKRWGFIYWIAEVSRSWLSVRSDLGVSAMISISSSGIPIESGSVRKFAGANLKQVADTCLQP